jgi:hypothetical protein
MEDRFRLISVLKGLGTTAAHSTEPIVISEDGFSQLEMTLATCCRDKSNVPTWVAIG